MDIVEQSNRKGPVSTRTDKGTDFWQEGVDFWRRHEPGIVEIIGRHAARTDGALRFGFDYTLGEPDTIILNLPRKPGDFLGELDSKTGINLFQGGAKASDLPHDDPRREWRLVACQGEHLDKLAAFEGPNKRRQFEVWLSDQVDAALGLTPANPRRKAPERKPRGKDL